MSMKSNGLRHIRSSPCHPFSNGTAEWVVQTLKKALVAGHRTAVPLEQATAMFVLCYCTTPHATT